jgi:hypothetical protein
MNRPGCNPTRRNRKIGTAAQGHGQNNRLVIPDVYQGKQDMIEDLDSPSFVEIAIASELRTSWSSEPEKTRCTRVPSTMLQPFLG